MLHLKALKKINDNKITPKDGLIQSSINSKYYSPIPNNKFTLNQSVELELQYTVPVAAKTEY